MTPMTGSLPTRPCSIPTSESRGRHAGIPLGLGLDHRILGTRWPRGFWERARSSLVYPPQRRLSVAAWPAGRPALEQRGWEWGGTQPVNGWNLPQVGQLDGWCLALKYLP